MTHERQIEKNESGRLTVGSVPTGMGLVTFRMGASWFIVLFLFAWLGGWVFGEVSVARSIVENLSNPGQVSLWFSLCWLIAWTLGGGAAISYLVWMLLGKEIVEIDLATLTHTYQVLGLRHVRTFRASQIEKLRFSEQQGEESKRSNLLFDYGTRTIRIFHQIDSGEATRAIAVFSKALGTRRQH